MLNADGTSTPPAAGVPSSGGSTSAIAGYSTQYNVPLGGQSNSQQTDPYIFTGTQKQPAHGGLPGSPEDKSAGRYWTTGRTMSELQSNFAQSGADNQRHWAYLLALAGYAGISNSDPKSAAQFAKTAPLQFVMQAHDGLLKDAADQFQMGRKITPQQMISDQLKYRFGDQYNGKLSSLTPDGAGALGGSLAGTHTTTSKSVDLMSPEDAKGMVRSTLQNALGRDPTQAEYEDFIATIHAAERKNPTVSNQTTTTDSQGNTTNQNTTTSGGLNQSGYDQLLTDKAKSMPSWAVWQAMGTYAPALYAALDAPVKGV